MLVNKDIICISDLSWDAHWSTEQQFMSRLCKSNRVLYVNQPDTWLTPIQKRLLKRDSKTGRSNIVRGLEKRQDQLFIATLPPLLPFRYTRLANSWNNRQYIRHIRRWAKELEMRSPILWTYEPSACKIAESVNHSLLIYHCLDCWTGHKDWWNSDKSIVKCEDQLVEQSDFVITVSESLYREKVRLNPNTHFVPNGADHSHFSKALRAETQIPVEMQAIGHPLVGYIGMIGFRLDAETLYSIARAKPEWNIVLVGGAHKSDRALALLMQMPNVHFLGMQPIEKLPSFLKAMDVCLIPYRKNSFSDNCFPLKLFEYLSAGKPIVASPIPALVDYSKYVYISNTPEEYLKNIELALASDSAMKIKERIAFAKGNSWEARLREIGDILDSVP